MKAIITGAHGFIASHLADYLKDCDYQVIGIDNMVSGSKHLDPSFRNYDADIRDFQTLDRIFAVEKPDVVFHLAAVSRTPWAVKEPVYTVEVNDAGSVKVLEAARRNGVKKVVLASSNIVYAGDTLYKTTKLAMESHARVYDKLYGLPTLCLRFANVAGSRRQHPDNVLMALSESKRKNGYITITGAGKQQRDFVSVFDVCEALFVAMNSDVHCDEIDICTGKMWELNEIAEMFGCEAKHVGEREGDIEILQMQGPERAKELLNWEAKQGLKDYISVYTDI